MKFHVDGEEFEIPDKDVKAYVEALDKVDEDAEIEIVPPNKYVFGVNVTHTGELAKAGKDIRAFMDTIGEGEVEIQVSVNAKLNEFKDKVMGFNVEREPAIGHAEMNEYD
ncbi:MAG: hypothetical protein LC650_02980, partial [Actinobacteria bacterium]|nr:hypothetical protein [Actinomycetota bacterium]